MLLADSERLNFANQRRVSFARAHYTLRYNIGRLQRQSRSFKQLLSSLEPQSASRDTQSSSF
jgi:hypothetical protein